ncbi:VOC family protein [Mycolicibacterium grossiae]|uniref:Glyoxalase n=1 Tax=Mycolicibacterium grossiae TaxID=1552759 RepID=A0A1E8Q0K2_9MYCO|nr:VOC family protein [Mycolicibacterium grossiae]OFJ52042.1 glyoxalase [Mycolicibacterium grossiae]QEM47748.1 VOC family protein [Mycolicibacterium grossiae]
MGLTFTALCIDARDVRGLAQWWSTALGWPLETDDDGDVLLRAPAGPDWLFLGVPEEKTVKNRLHLDFRPDDQQAEVDRLLALGARHADVGQGDETWVVLADPEGNEFCVLAAKG